MPTYEYECTQCGRVLELFQSITEQPKRKLDCDACGDRVPVRRLLGTGGGVVFKGSGFYTTDYRSDSYKKAAKADASSKDGKGKTTESAEPKPKDTSSERSDSA